MRLPTTGTRLLTCVAATATILCAGALAQAQTRGGPAEPPPVRARPAEVTTGPNGNLVITMGTLDGDDGQLSGATQVLYNNNIETGSRYQPAETTPLPTVVLDDIPVPLSRLNGQTKISVRRVTIGLRRAGATTAPVSVPTNVRAYYGTVSNTLVPGNITQIPGVVSLPVNGAAGFVTQLVTWGDGITELFNVDLNMNAVPGHGTFVFGGSCSGDAVSAPNGFRLTSGPDANVSNIFWLHNPNTNTTSGAAFAAPTLSTFYLRVEGVPDDCNAPLERFWCQGDINDDGAVNVTDLLAVIGAWGATGPTKPAADRAPLPNGDCTVNVTDLLAVIGGWGACPTAGACCVNGSCIIANSAADCANLGGTFTYPTQVCANVVCPPDNDPCTGAFTAVIGENNFSNAGATVEPGTPGGDCLAGGAAVFTRDVWFKYTTGSTGGVFDISLCSTVAPVTDTALSVYLGTCGGLIEIACNDDNCPPGFLSRIPETPFIPPNTTMYIRVGSWGNDPANQGAMKMNLAFTPLTDDVCVAAGTVAIGGSVSGTLGNATSDLGASCQGVTTGVGRWVRVVGNGNTLTASTCSSIADVYDGKLIVYCGTDCGNLVCVAGSDADIGTPQNPAVCAAFQGEKVNFCTVNNQTYWIYVAAPNIPTGVTGHYTLTVTDTGNSCVNTIDCNPNAPPPNDTCDTAIVATLGNTPFSNALATPATATLTMCGQPASKDVWFTFTPTNGGTTTVTVNAAAPFNDSIVTVYTGTCAALTQVVCNDDPSTCVACHGLVTFTATAGTTYRIQVGNWSTSAGGFGNLVISQP